MKQTFLLMVLALGMFSINVSAQTKKYNSVKRTTSKRSASSVTKTREVGKDGFIWYLIKKGNLYGVQDIEGKVIIPIKYDLIVYYSDRHRYFMVVKGDFKGIYTRKGTLVIPTDRHYTSVMSGHIPDEAIDMVFWEASKNDGGAIALDARGNEVISGDRNYPKLLMDYDYGTKGAPYYFSVFSDYSNTRFGICNLDGEELLPMKYEHCWIANGNIRIQVNEEYITNNINYQGSTRFDYNSFDDLYNYSFSYSILPSKPSNPPSPSSSDSPSSKDPVPTPKPTPTPKPVPTPTPTPTPVPVQEWVQCTACWGSTICPNCAGSGTTYIGSNLHRCSRCAGRKICTSCSGQGGRYITVYK